jgi:hypothetical protein
MATSYTGVAMKIRVAAVADRATFNRATATFYSLSVRSVDPSFNPETFAFDAETGDTDSFWTEGEDTVGMGWSMGFDGYYHHDDAGYLVIENALYQENLAGAAVTQLLYVEYYPIGDATTGARFYHGFATPSELGIPGDRGGAIDNSYTLNGKGKLFRGTVA